MKDLWHDLNRNMNCELVFARLSAELRGRAKGRSGKGAMKTKLKCAVLVIALAVISARSVKADTLDYTLFEETGSGNVQLASWTMSSTPTPTCPEFMTVCYAAGEFFGIDTDVTVGGASTPDTLAVFNTTFTGPSDPIDLNDVDGLFPELVGQQLYTMNSDAAGCTSAEQCPEMIVPASGSFMLGSDTQGFGDVQFILDVADVSTPEPSTILLLAIGLMGLAFVVRKRQFAL